jgi:ABC-type multidrug transport system fused ATPase/permease subunit
MLSTAAIRSAGGSDRELSRIEKYSQVLAAASIERAKVAGAMRGTAAAMSGIATAMMIGTGLVAGLPTSNIAAALTIVGFLAAPIYDLGRVVEYRETYLAAQRVVGPPIDNPGVWTVGPAELIAVPSTDVGRTVVAALLKLSDGRTMPDLAVQPGARVVLDAGSDLLTSEVLDRFVGLREGYDGAIVVGGRDLSVAAPTDLRRLVGYAAQGMMLVRGTVSWTVRYRSPETGPDEVDRLLEEVGLKGLLAELVQGADTLLVHGGEPLTIDQRARLLLARALLDEPPLLVFDRLDADLGTDGRGTMRRLLADYPGVVVLASDDPHQIVSPTHFWRPGGVHRIAPASAVGGQPA